jgi:hypothetical protein
MLSLLQQAEGEREGYVRRLELAMGQLRAAQEEVVRSEKLAVVGQLAAGVAHEIGNPIASILGFTELLLADPELPPEEAQAPERMDCLRRVRQEAERVDAIVRGLLDFARPLPCQVQALDINPLVEEAAGLITHRQGTRGGQVRLSFEPAPDLPPVHADRGQLLQVLVNLMLNALDAMPQGGELHLSSRALELGAGEVAGLRGLARRAGDPPGADFSGRRQAAEPAPGPERFVEVAVADTGCGIEAKELGRLFDPFYTTKPPGSGTGLGLAISLRIVRSFAGSIRVSSEPGRGSTFSVLLPAAPEEETA